MSNVVVLFRGRRKVHVYFKLHIFGFKKWIRFIHITFKQYDRITKQKTSKILKQKITKFPKLVVYYIYIKYGLSTTTKYRKAT